MILMRGITGWQYRPYRPMHRLNETQLPFICRLAPESNAIELEWFDMGNEEVHILKWRLKDKDMPWNVMPANTAAMRISGLDSQQDYELYICRKNAPEESSAIRYA